MKTKEFKNKKGITLIALIVTIIIILIISGITISTLTGHNGIINNATNAKKSSEKSAIYEQIRISTQSALSTKTLKVNEDKFKQALSNSLGQEGTAYTITGNNEKGWIVTSKNHSFIINEEAKIWDVEDIEPLKTSNTKTNKTIAVRDQSNPKEIFFLPENFKIASDSALIINEGIVVEDEEGNQFVWVPVPYPIANSKAEGNTKKSMALKLNNGYYKGLLYLFNESSSNIADDGYHYQEPSYISDLDNTTDSYTVGNLDEEYKDMILSVSEYKGFYIGRFETGYETKNGQMKIVSKSAKIYNTVTTTSANHTFTRTWYGLYSKQKNFSTSGKVRSSMIWGSQWDAMLHWMRKNNISVTTDPGSNYNSTIVTGNSEIDKILNIYDLYGCHYEYTLQSLSATYRSMRSGLYVDGYALNKRSHDNSYRPDKAPGQTGSRMTLYIVE